PRGQASTAASPPEANRLAAHGRGHERHSVARGRDRFVIAPGGQSPGPGQGGHVPERRRARPAGEAREPGDSPPAMTPTDLSWEDNEVGLAVSAASPGTVPRPWPRRTCP